MKIWYQSLGDLSTLPKYRASLEAHTSQMVESSNTVEVHGVREGTYGSGNIPPLAFTKYPYFKYLNQLQMVDNALLAEREGFDAFVNGCFHDPALREIRSVVDIPILSLAETSMLVACSYGRAFGVVTLCKEFEDYTRILAHDYGLDSRLAGIETMHPPVDELVLENPVQIADDLKSGFYDTCKRLSDLGAEVIIPGDGNLNEALYTLKVHESAGLPVMDAVGTLVKMAECYVGLKERTGLTTSRAGFYAKPPLDQLKEVRGYYGLS